VNFFFKELYGVDVNELGPGHVALLSYIYSKVLVTIIRFLYFFRRQSCLLIAGGRVIIGICFWIEIVDCLLHTMIVLVIARASHTAVCYSGYSATCLLTFYFSKGS
jgi:hypothetical protein